MTSGFERASLASYRPSTTRAQWAAVLVVLTMMALVVEGAVLVDGLSRFEFVSTPVPGDLSAWASAVTGAENAYTTLMVVSGIAVLTWLSRVVDNIPALGGGKPVSGPRGAILWWFVPVAFLIQPYRIVADAWRRLGPNGGGPGELVVLAWWLLWLGSAMAGRLVASSTPGTMDELRAEIQLELVPLAGSIVAGLLLLVVIWQIEHRSTARADALAGESPAVLAALEGDPAG